MEENTDKTPDPSDENAMPHEDGEVITSMTGVEEKIVYDYDDNDNILGWHKEVV